MVFFPLVVDEFCSFFVRIFYRFFFVLHKFFFVLSSRFQWCTPPCHKTGQRIFASVYWLQCWKSILTNFISILLSLISDNCWGELWRFKIPRNIKQAVWPRKNCTLFVFCDLTLSDICCLAHVNQSSEHHRAVSPTSLTPPTYTDVFTSLSWLDGFHSSDYRSFDWRE